MCVVVIVSAEPLPFACVLMFWYTWDVSGHRVGAFPQVNDGVQIRLRADKTQRLDAVFLDRRKLQMQT